MLKLKDTVPLTEMTKHNGTGSLLMPLKGHDANGYQIISLSQIEDIILGEGLLTERFGVLARQANLCLFLKDKAPVFYRTNLDAFVKSYDSALKRGLGRCTSFTAAIPHVSPALLHKLARVVIGEGIYVGLWEPKTRSGRQLGMLFDIYAAPQDIQDEKGRSLLLTYNEAVAHLGALNTFCGRDVTSVANDTELHELIQNGNYAALENWFMPPREIVFGLDHDDDSTFKTPLISLQEQGDLKDTFHSKNDCYWSCTASTDDSNKIHAFNFKDKNRAPVSKNNNTLATRLVRAELRR
jgi:hypothetical protein